MIKPYYKGKGITIYHRHKWVEWHGNLICIVCGIRKVDWYNQLDAEIIVNNAKAKNE